MPEYTFKVRETLKRDRFYSLTAPDAATAERLLDGFKVPVREEAPANEHIEVDSYDVLEMWLPPGDPASKEK